MSEFNYEQVWKSMNPWDYVPENLNIGVASTDAVCERGLGNSVAIYWENSNGEARQITYDQLRLDTNRVASFLTKLGFGKGDVLLLRMSNLIEFYTIALGVAKAGGAFIPTSTMFREKDILYRLNDAKVKVVISTPQLVDVVDNIRDEAPTLEHVVVIDYLGEKPTSEKHLSYTKLMEEADENFKAVNTRNDDIAFIAYTSGTTGDPKGVVHFHRYGVAYEYLAKHWYNYDAPDVITCPAEIGWLLPVSSSFLYAMHRGMSVVLYHELGGFNPEKWFQMFEKYGISVFIGTPTMFRMLMNVKDAEKRYDLSKWREGTSAGEPLAPDTFENVQKRFGITIRDGIGMSECMVYVHNMVGMEIRQGSCGKIGAGITIELMEVPDEDSEDGAIKLKPVTQGEPGVLCVKIDSHPGMMKEYLNKPDATKEVFIDGWFYTGDVLRKDEDGYFWFIGRADDVIKASGYRISPFDVESALMSHPAVHEAAAVESPDPVRDKVVKAFIVLRQGYEESDALVKDLQNHVKEVAAPYKYPRKIQFVKELPKTQSGKVKRKLLRRMEFDGTPYQI
ncbi:acyl-CoA synthetase [Myxococcota bacterium]|nr:acyl-CoA synthetase [Myxococcota bacterium]MBU1380619.1 acyl-CoA synthetase [Myxococcota bacterium]MBU1496962.1 acyl-CoA synthetase [Myxococcota bacterium]